MLYEHAGPSGLERGARARDLGDAVQRLKQEPGRGLFVGGVKLPLALAELGLIDEYEFVCSRGWRATGRLVHRAIEASRLEARKPAGVRLGSVALRYERGGSHG